MQNYKEMVAAMSGNNQYADDVASRLAEEIKLNETLYNSIHQQQLTLGEILEKTANQMYQMVKILSQKLPSIKDAEDKELLKSYLDLIQDWAGLIEDPNLSYQLPENTFALLQKIIKLKDFFEAGDTNFDKIYTDYLESIKIVGERAHVFTLNKSFQSPPSRKRPMNAGEPTNAGEPVQLSGARSAFSPFKH